MRIKQALPIGKDDFRKLREGNFYYVDKTLMIKEFIEMQDEVALIARPRRFGKTLNMTMIREFFDITLESGKIFEGLAIMDTEYAVQINSRPVIYLTFKDCKGSTAYALLILVKRTLYQEYLRFEKLLRDKVEKDSFETKDFYRMIDVLRDTESSYAVCSAGIQQLIMFVHNSYGVMPLLLIDEYDQPIISSYQYGYHDEIGVFFSILYGSAMKGNPALGQALLTGVQRVVKESIFSQFNNPKVYTVMSKQYNSCFGLTALETGKLLADYDLDLDERVEKKYDGYCFGSIQMYNPWSVLCYADNALLENYWVNTSSNFLIKQALQRANKKFWDNFEQMLSGKEIAVALTLETSYIERDSSYSLWGLLVNAGYLTVLNRIDENAAIVKIPNNEVMSEFQVLIAEISGIDGMDLRQMFQHLLKQEMDDFLAVYQDIVLSCTSYMDAKENAYHMLFLGMCITLRGAYHVSSTLESGHGRSDIILEALDLNHSHVVIEFKQGQEDELDRLKEDALQQILDNQYYAGLKGEVICVGMAHDKKHCRMGYKTLYV